MLEAAIAAGCNLAFIGSDISGLVENWSQLLAAFKPSAAAKPARQDRSAEPVAANLPK